MLPSRFEGGGIMQAEIEARDRLETVNILAAGPEGSIALSGIHPMLGKSRRLRLPLSEATMSWTPFGNSFGNE